MNEIIEVPYKPILEQLEELCKLHDWDYEYSDDHSIWKKGDKKQKEIDRLAKLCRQRGLHKEALDIMHKYSDQY